MSREARPPVGMLPAEGGKVRSGWHLLHIGRRDPEVGLGFPDRRGPGIGPFHLWLLCYRWEDAANPSVSPGTVPE